MTWWGYLLGAGMLIAFCILLALNIWVDWDQRKRGMR